VHQFRIRNAILAGAGVDSSDPKAPECTLFAAAIAVGVAHGLIHRIFGNCQYIFARAKVAFGSFQDFFAPAPGGYGIY
jgi:hypothetical protein